jgi:hypothetical protein
MISNPIKERRTTVYAESIHIILPIYEGPKTTSYEFEALAGRQYFN